MALELASMTTTSSVSQISIRLRGKRIAGAEDRQRKVPGFDQQVFSRAKVVCIGAGGLTSHIAPTLARKGIAAVSVLDHDIVEESNLSRQLYYPKDLGRNKAFSFVENLKNECTFDTELVGYGVPFEAAIAKGLDLNCDVAICGVDNNPTRVSGSRYFRDHEIPVIFTAVSANADHGYVFVQEKVGPCFGCLFPDAVDDHTYPCPGTPAMTDILQAVGALAVYAVDTCLMARPRTWNYRRIWLSDGAFDSVQQVPGRLGCPLCGSER
jgi:molybdopterin/thiamine biosynthesis adenylyltransferase